jgi:anti-anti-sigma factor
MYLMTSKPPIPEPCDLPAEPPLMLDLGGVESLSAAGIGELVGLRSRLRASGGQLVLTNVGDHARRAIEESRLAGVLGVCRNGTVQGEGVEGGEGAGKA